MEQKQESEEQNTPQVQASEQSSASTEAVVPPAEVPEQSPPSQTPEPIGAGNAAPELSGQPPVETVGKKGYGILALFGILAVILLGFVAFWQISSTNNQGAGQQQALSEITVMVSLPLGLSIGKSIANSVQLAFEEIGYEINGQKVNVLVKDDGDANGSWSPGLEEKNARLAAQDPSVVAYIGPFNSGAGKISMPILNRAGILQVSPGNTWPGLTRPGFAPGEPGVFFPTGIRHYFRVVPTDDYQGPAAARWVEDLGVQSVYIIDDGEAYGRGIADLFESEISGLNIEIKGRETLSQSKTGELIDRVLESEPELVYYGGITPNGIIEFVRALRGVNTDIAIMGPDGIQEQDFINRIGAQYAEGVYATTVGIPVSQLTSKEAQNYYRSYKDRYGIEPEVYGAYGYESAKVVIQAIRFSEVPTRNNVMQAIKVFPAFRGIFGTWKFDTNGDTSLRTIGGYVVQNGVFEFVREL